MTQKTARQSRKMLRYRWHPWVLLVASLLVTAYSGIAVYRQESIEAGSQFAVTAGEIRTKIEGRIHAYQQVLRGGVGLFAAVGQVDRDQWHRYVKQLNLEKGFPGIQGVGFAIHLTPGQLAEHERQVREEGYPEYRVWPQCGLSECSAIVYLEPFTERNLRAFGYDMLSESVRRAAMDAARDTGNIAASGKVKLVQETDTDVQPGFLIYMPLYRQGALTATPEQRRQASVGWVYAPFRMRDLLEGILGNAADAVHLRIYDAGIATADHLLFDSRVPAVTEASPPMRAFHRIDVGNRVWGLELRALPVFLGGAFDYGKVILVALSGVLVSFLLFAIARSLAMSNARGRMIAERLTASLRRSRELHHRLVTFSHEGVIAMDAAADVTYVNPRMAEILGYDPNDMVGKSFLDFIEPGEHDHVRQELESRRCGNRATYEVGMLRNGGESIFTLLSAAPLLDDEGVFQGSFVMVADITERKRAEQALLESESRFRNLAQSARDAIISIDAQGRVVSWNQAATRIFGFSEEEMLGSTVTRIMPCRIAEVHPHYVDRYLSTRIPHIIGKTYEMPGQRCSGEEFPLELSLSEWKSRGQLFFTAIIRDISERVRAETALRESEERLRRAVTQAPIPIMIHAEDGEVILLSRAWEELSGYALADLPIVEAWVQKAYGDRPEDMHTIRSQITAIFEREETTADGEYAIRARNGHRVIWDFRSSLLGTMSDGRRLAITMAMDVTDRRAIEEKVHHLAHYDALTDLPNRILLQDRIGRALALARRTGGALALIYFDLDYFKSINDSLGHAVGDALLVAAAQRLKSCMRDSDTVGRFGGDEFLALLPEIASETQAAVVGEKIRKAMAEPFVLSGKTLSISSSIGIALFPRDGEDFDALLKCSDVAMYEAKGQGRNRICFFSPVSTALDVREQSGDI